MRRTLAATLLALLLPFSTAAAPVALVLEQDPPLPGEPLTGWEALEPGAPTAEGLDVAEAVALTLSRHPQLQALRADIASARGALLAAGALPNPTLEVELLSLGAGQVGQAPASLGLELDLTEFVHAPLGAAAARPEVEAARLRLEEATLRLSYEAKAAWYDTWAAETAWGGSIRAVDALAAGRDAQRAITAAGNAPTLELAQKEVAYEEARARAAALELEVVAARERLARLLGQDPGPLAPAPPLVAPALPQDLEGAAAARSLALQAMDLEIQAAERRRTAARLEGLAPELGAFVEAERRTGPWEATAGLALSLPLLSFGRGEVMRAEAEADRLTAERLEAEVEVRSAAREAHARFVSALARARHAQDVLVPAREALLAETLLHYNAMQLGLDALLDAWRGRVEVEITAADAMREAHTAAAALDAILSGARVAPPRAARSSASSTPNASGGH